VADENVSGPSADAEAPNGDEVIEDTAAEPETTDAPEGVADAENLPVEQVPEGDVPGSAEANAEPEASAEPAQPESTEEPAEGPPADDAAELVEEPAAEPVAEAESTDEPAEGAPREDAAAESSETDEAAPVSASDSAKRKRKRLPRSLRRQRSKPTRERPAERKPIARLPKLEHERGRRQERQGTVVSAAADKTIVVRVDTVKVHPMYKKVIKRSTKLHAHDEANEAKVGDIVRLVETRPLSKLKRWRLQEVVEAAK
jgi:small subunit ribosomal protein S17